MPQFFHRALIRFFGTALTLLTLALATPRAQGAEQGTDDSLMLIVSGSTITDAYAVNVLVGADRFYDAGIYGQGTITANVESGLVSNTNAWLTTVDDYYVPTGALNQVTDHATAVGTVLAAYDPTVTGAYPYYKLGMAPSTYLSSGAIATSYGSDGAFDMSYSTLYNAYNHYFTASWTQTVTSGGTTTIRSVPTSVINSSWGYTDSTGRDPTTLALDGMARANPQTTLVVSAGNATNATSTSNNVVGPASGFNSISVGSIGDGTEAGVYKVSDYSSRGPQDFAYPDGTVVKNARATVDLVAPGYYILTSYDETTGTLSAMSGTSFSAPVVSGAVSLLKSLSYTQSMGDNSRDTRVVKAVLMNSATKLTGWDNGQSVNAQGVTVTTQALDWTQGAGMLNLNKAYDQYASGTQDVAGTGGGTVDKLGWDYGEVGLNQHNDYTINLTLQATAKLDVTLSWFRDLASPVLTDNDDATLQTLTTEDLGFANLYLEIWDSTFTHLYAESMTDYNTVQELSFTLPEDGNYAIRVLYAKDLYGDLATEDYGLAWYVEAVDPVPEPGAFALLGLGGVIVWFARRHFLFRTKARFVGSWTGCPENSPRAVRCTT